jgi:CDP-diacylglycerol--glycerol-3-phosphate 3-phosphatidyltransferase
MNIANIFSLFRIITIPVIIYLLYQETYTSSILALGFLILAFISDRLDGYVARKMDTVTKIGSFLDPFADKLLVVFLLLVFWLRDSFSIYYLVVFVLRDIVFLAIRMLASREDIDIKQEKRYSTRVINSQFFLVLVLILRELFFNAGYDTVMFPTVLVTIFAIGAVIVSIWSVVMYWIVYSKLLSTKKKIGKLAKREKMVVLANKKSSGYRDRYRRRLLKKFCKRRKAKLIYLPKTNDMYKGIATKIKDFKYVVIAGGDGSFESAMNHKAFWKKSLGFFPLGAGNAYYSHFFKGKKFEYLHSRFKFRQVLLDVLEMEYNDKKVQTCFMSAGVDSEVPRLTEEMGHGVAGYVKGGYVAFKEAKGNYDLVVTIDSKRHHLKNAINLTLAKIPYYGYSIRSLVGKTNMGDNQVYGLAVVNRHSRLANKPLRLWTFLLTAFNMERDPLMPLCGKEIKVESKESFPLQAGGEFLGYSQKIKIKVVRQQKVLMI